MAKNIQNSPQDTEQNQQENKYLGMTMNFKLWDGSCLNWLSISIYHLSECCPCTSSTNKIVKRETCFPNV